MTMMNPSRTARIYILLALDLIFFLLEIIVGYAVGSLALVADSFHMLNDVVSLVIALYAIKLTASSTPSTRYSYGWHRAEILAALVNGVFLLALCFSITLEALQRFFSTPEVSNPKLIVVVGSFGLLSNIIGLFLFHEHGHSHDHSHHSAKSSKAPSIHSTMRESVLPIASPVAISQTRPSAHHGERAGSYSSLYGHPAATRASFVQTANNIARSSSPAPVDRAHKPRSRPSLDPWSPDSVNSPPYESETAGAGHAISAGTAHEQTSLLQHSPVSYTDTAAPTPADWSPEGQGHTHGHSHGGSMNMKALLLHVLGDALGNVGVIATGLIIWLTSWSFKYYCDPVISLLITVIIFHSALPLVRSTSFILLQGVPSEVSLEAVRSEILTVEGVLSVHELHIWQLSETKIIASVHVTASRKVDFMPVASNIRRVLHQHGIHSSTIQPEYHPIRDSVPEENLKSSQDTSCLISCPPDRACNEDQACCRKS
ncbi:cation efflux protein [Multifurca ochricompacta]|uniref:Cation efflux protein n=1 Tax=Multifurca ochricompacta TaxID=376703 RepID=A0AAD4QTU9_9AGAM|nr:cation efflux protein [Multifurca ochricompacta]